MVLDTVASPDTVVVPLMVSIRGRLLACCTGLRRCAKFYRRIASVRNVRRGTSGRDLCEKSVALDYLPSTAKGTSQATPAEAGFLAPSANGLSG